VIISVSFCNLPKPEKDNKKQHKLPSAITDSTLYTSFDTNKNKFTMHAFSYGPILYDLNKPDERYSLPPYLKEISGLAYYKEDKIICIQDEKANIFVFSLEKKVITNKYKFGKDGDYEDVALTDQTTFVLRSDGTIFEIENLNKENRKITEHKTPLSSKNNTEGLTFDKISNSLLIACKGSPQVGKDNPFKGYKAIYLFDLGEMKLNKKPIILIRSEKSFQPSGIAINPVNDQIYIISSVGKTLIILDRQGKIIDLQNLDPEIFLQPEGICFSPSGDLFISSEGKSGHGYILKFNKHND
jgi:uncharacterized protein YjiK